MTYNPLTATPPTSVLANAKSATNNTSSTINKATPVRITSSGSIALIDPSVESEVDGLAGLVKADVLSGNSVDVISSGTIEDVTTSAGFGDTIYLSKTGGLTSTKPSIGVNGFVAGDWVVRLGVITKNQTNPALKDLLVNIQFAGQL